MSCVLVTVACAGSGGDTAGGDGEQVPWIAPDQPGHWDPGTLEDSFTPSHGETLKVQVWFPGQGTDEDPYAYDGLISGLAAERTDPDCGEARPVVVFSHGNSGVRWQSIFLTEHLASHGYVVVAPDHVRNTFFDFDSSVTGEIMVRRPVDVAESFDWLAQVAGGPGGPLEGCIDADDGYAVSGHSFGGFTTYATAGAGIDLAASMEFCATVGDPWLCEYLADQAAADGVDGYDLADDRVWAAVPMAPAGYEVLLAGLADIQVPLLSLGGGKDELTTMAGQVQPLFDGAVNADPRHQGVLEDAGHFTFSNACDWIGTYEECKAPYLAPEAAYPVIYTSTLAFLSRVRGDARMDDFLPPTTDAVFSWE